MLPSLVRRGVVSFPGHVVFVCSLCLGGGCLAAWIIRKAWGVSLPEDTPPPGLTSSKMTLGLILPHLFVFIGCVPCYLLHTARDTAAVHYPVLLSDSVNNVRYKVPLEV